MEWVIKLLEEKLQVIDHAYDEFVVNGSVNKNSDVVIQNRDISDQLKTALEILKGKHNDSDHNCKRCEM